MSAELAIWLIAGIAIVAGLYSLAKERDKAVESLDQNLQTLDVRESSLTSRPLPGSRPYFPKQRKAMHLPQLVRMTNLPPKPRAGYGLPKLTAIGIPDQHYENKEHGIHCTARQAFKGAEIKYEWRSDSLPGHTFPTYTELRDAHNALPGNGRPAHMLDGPEQAQ